MKYWNVKKWRITAVISSHVNVVATVIKKRNLQSRRITYNQYKI